MIVAAPFGYLWMISAYLPMQKVKVRICNMFAAALAYRDITYIVAIIYYAH